MSKSPAPSTGSPPAGRDDRAARVVRWWAALNGSDKGPPDRATLAKLRRCHTATDAFAVPAFVRLLPRFGGWITDPDNDGPKIQRIAIAAIALAHVRHNVPKLPVARQVGPSKIDANDGKLSEARFRRLMRIDDGDTDDLLRAMVRLVRQLDRTVNANDLVRSILSWNDHTRRRWAFSYFNADQPKADMSAAASRDETTETQPEGASP